MFEIINNELQNNWKEELEKTGIGLEFPISTTVVNGGKGKDRKVIFLIFSRGASNPALSIKLARTEDYNKRLINEYHALKAIGEFASGENFGIPLPVGLFHYEGLSALIERIVPGEAYSRLLRTRKRTSKTIVKTDLIQIFEWLNNFQCTMPFSSIKVNLTEEIKFRLKRISGNQSVQIPSSFIDGLYKMSENYADIKIPLVACHGDFFPGNVFFSGNDIGVIDWEDFRQKDWFVNDFFQFIVIFGQIFPWNPWRMRPNIYLGFEKTFLSRNWLSNFLLSYTQKFFSMWDLPFDFTHLFFTLFLIDKAAPTAALGPKRLQQSAVWRQRLIWYIENEKRSIYNHEMLKSKF